MPESGAGTTSDARARWDSGGFVGEPPKARVRRMVHRRDSVGGPPELWGWRVRRQNVPATVTSDGRTAAFGAGWTSVANEVAWPIIAALAPIATAAAVPITTAFAAVLIVTAAAAPASGARAAPDERLTFTARSPATSSQQSSPPRSLTREHPRFSALPACSLPRSIDPSMTCDQ